MGEARDERPCDDPNCWCCHPPDPNRPMPPAFPAGLVTGAAVLRFLGKLVNLDRRPGVVRVDTGSDETVERVAEALRKAGLALGHTGWDEGGYKFRATLARAVLASLLDGAQ